jgi:hypothetical protein
MIQRRWQDGLGASSDLQAVRVMNLNFRFLITKSQFLVQIHQSPHD